RGSSMTVESELLRSALAYIRRGWHVFPIYEMGERGQCSCRSDCGKNQGKHPRPFNGVKNAATEPQIIHAWWTRWPTANVGIATGRESGLVVLDQDPRNDGEESLMDLEAKCGLLPETVSSITGGGGTHQLFAHPGDRTILNRTNLGGYSGLDFKADGGYIVAPPSNHVSGSGYVWNVLLHPDDVPFAPCPEVLLKLAEEGPPSERVSCQHEAWDGKLPSHVMALLKIQPRVRKRFHRATDGLNDTSPSGVDYSLACLLALFGLKDTEIEHGLRASRAKASLPPKRLSYFNATIGKAIPAMRMLRQRAESVSRYDDQILEEWMG
ncbi:MAG: bifunctional DNA primase/polymerase, partial [Gemmatimonadota bacterium]